jgi:MFS family permease
VASRPAPAASGRRAGRELTVTINFRGQPLTTRKSLAAFRHRNYRLFWYGQLVSLVGTWVQTVAEAWLVLTLTNDPLALGLVSVARFVPVLVLGLFGGVIADNLPKRKTLIGTQFAQMILAFCLTTIVVTGVVQVWMVMALAFLLGCANAIDMPTRQSFVVEMVGKDDIANAVAFNSAMFNAARVVGPAIAGLAIGVFGLGLCFFLNGLSFVAVIGGLLIMRDEELHLAPPTSRPKTVGAVFSNLADGLAYVGRTPAILLAILTIGLSSTFALNFSVSVPPMVQAVLHSDAAGYGFLMASCGVGSLIAALTIALSGRASVRMLLAGTTLMSVAFTLFGVSSSYLVSLVCMFFVGVGMIVMAASANTVIQLAVPDQLRGRVMAVYTTVFAGSTPFGGLATGAVASTYGIAVAVILGGLLSVLVAIGGIAYAVRHPHVIRPMLLGSAPSPAVVTTIA